MARISLFGVTIRPGKLGTKLTRENYAIIDNKCTTHEKVDDYYNMFWGEKRREAFLKIYEDESATTYTYAWCEEHKRKVLFNFDLNMKFFESLAHDEFSKEIDRFLKKNNAFKEITNLNLAIGKSGYYILILDEYCQIYIGTAKNIKRRVMSHWSKKKQFDRLIFGSVERSKLSIDSFRALDTTRILATFTDGVYTDEDDYINAFSSKFLANRTSGGIPEFGGLSILANAKHRNLEDFN